MARPGRKSQWDTLILPRLEAIKAWCRDGYTDKQICEALGTSQDTFCKYKRLKPELVEALKIDREIADLTVENSLYKRATGCTIVETIEEVYGSPTNELDENGKRKIRADKIHRKTITREIPPDPTSGFFWLQNRSPQKWRDRKNIEITGKDGGPVEARMLDKEQYIKIREQMLKNDDC